MPIGNGQLDHYLPICSFDKPTVSARRFQANYARQWIVLISAACPSTVPGLLQDT